jgi:chloride channel protein, CIC family
MNYISGNWFKWVKERIINSKIRANILQALPFWIGALLTGLIAVLYTKMFGYAEALGQQIFHWHSWSLFILTPVCFVLAWWVVIKFDKRSAGSGIPQVMAAIELANPRHNYLADLFLNIKTVVVKIVSTLLMILGGGVIGREGPTVQIAGSVFRMVNKWLPASWPKVSKRIMIMTGAAAGLAAAFNTPLGGIVFAVEELAKTHISYFKTALFTGVIIAGLTAQGILGSYLYLGYPEIGDVSGTLIFFVLLVACITGYISSAIGVLILKIIRWKQKMSYPKYQLLYVIGCALLIASIAFFLNAGILGSGKTEMSRLLFSNDKHVGFFLPIYRIIGSVASFTTGAAGGIFAPSLSAGAVIGALVAEIFKFTDSNATVLILSGMVAFLTGITRSPFTSAILVLEMTDRHSVVFYLMAAALAASLFANILDKHSLYDHIKDAYLKDAYELDIQTARGEPDELIIEDE